MFRLMRLESRVVLDGAAPLDCYEALEQLPDPQDMPGESEFMELNWESLLLSPAPKAEPVRVLVVPEGMGAGPLSQAADDAVICLSYDFGHTSPTDLAKGIQNALHGKQAASIAFAAHGHGEGWFFLSQNEPVSTHSLSSDPEQFKFWEAVGDMLAPEGRIDLLGCSLAGSEAGQDLIAAIQGLSGVAVAASDDPTGDGQSGGDWILETHDLDAAALYFDSSRLERFQGLLAPPEENPDNPVPAALSLYEGGVLFYDLGQHVVDPDGDPLRYDLAQLFPPDFDNSAGLIAVAEDGTLSLSKDLPAGDYALEFIADDETPGGTEDFLVTLDVNPLTDPNAAPIQDPDNPLPDKLADIPAGQAYSYDLSEHIQDPDGDELLFFLEGVDPAEGISPSDLRVSNDGDLTISKELAAGEYSLSFSANDRKPDGLSSWTLDLEVKAPPNDPPTDKAGDPVPETLGSIEAGEGLEYNLAQHVTDPDGDPLVYSLRTVSPAGELDPQDIVISQNGALAISDAVLPGRYSFTFGASDLRGGEALWSIRFEVREKGNLPPEILPDQAFSVYENSSDGALVGLVEATDDEDTGELSYAIVGGTGQDLFAVDPENGIVTLIQGGTLDFEVQQSYTLEVEATDTEGLSDTETLTVNVLESPAENQAPAIKPDQVFSVSEDSPGGTLLGLLSVSDEDLANVSYAITGGTGQAIFQLDDNGLITLIADDSLDYETQKQYQLAVKVTDDEGLSDTETVIIQVLDAPENQAPDIAADQVFPVSEDSPAGSIVGLIAVSDEDPAALKYETIGGSGDDLFGVNPNNGLITLLEADILDADRETEYTLDILVTDSQGLADSATVTIKVLEGTPENNPPVYNSQRFEIEENSPAGTQVGTAQASDPDGDAIKYEITGGNPEDAFVINADTGEIFVNNSQALDYESIPRFTLTVEAEDNGQPPRWDIATVTIDLIDLADGNKDPQVNGENPPPDPLSWPVGLALDYDLSGHYIDRDGDNLRYQLLAIEDLTPDQGDTEWITELTSQGVLSGDAPNHERAGEYQLTVAVRDGNGGVFEDIFRLDVVNSAPQIKDAEFAIQENSPEGTRVGVVQAGDINGDILSFAIIDGNPEAAFGIDKNSGEIFVNEPEMMDYETRQAFELTVEVMDDAPVPLRDTATVTVNLLDVFDDNEAPVYPDQSFFLEENTGAGTRVGFALATDADGDNLIYSILSGNTGGAFLMNPNTGEIRVNNAEMLDYESQPVFELTAGVRDDGFGELTDTATLTIQLIDINEGPTAQADTAETTEDQGVWLKVLENDPDRENLGIVSVDTGQTIGAVSIEDAVIFYDPGDAFNYLTLGETGTDRFEYAVADEKGRTDTATVTVTVKGINDLPQIGGTGADLRIPDNDTVQPFSDFTIKDLDGEDEVHTVRVWTDGPDNGDFVRLAGFSPQAEGGYAFTGTSAGVQSAVQGLTFAPGGHKFPFETTQTQFFMSVENHGQTLVIEPAATVTATSSVLPPDPDAHIPTWERHGRIRIDFEAPPRVFASEILGLSFRKYFPMRDLTFWEDHAAIFTDYGLPVFELQWAEIEDFDFGFDDQTEDIYELANRMVAEARAMAGLDWTTGKPSEPAPEEGQPAPLPESEDEQPPPEGEEGAPEEDALPDESVPAASASQMNRQTENNKTDADVSVQE